MTRMLNEESFLDNIPYLLHDGKKRYLFFREEAKIMCLEETAQGWGEAQALPLRGQKMCAALDAYRGLHLLVVDNGKFSHALVNSGQFSAQVFHDEADKECSHFLFAGDARGNLHLLYLALDRPGNRWWLIHHRYAAERWEEPRVVDFGSGTPCNYGELEVDQSGGVHLVYRISEGNHSQLYYRFFTFATLSWSKALPLCAPGHVYFPNLRLDADNNLHLVWAAQKEDKYYVHYRQKLSGGWPSGGWRGETVVSQALSELPFPFVHVHREICDLHWLTADTLWKLTGTKEMMQVQIPRAGLLRLNRFKPGGAPAVGWTVGQGNPPLPLEQPAGTPPEESEEEVELEPYFKRLRQYSEVLLNQANYLSTSKYQLEQALEEKKKEMAIFSMQNEKHIENLRQDLQNKNKALQELEMKFNQTVNSLKLKIEQERKSRDEERKRFLRELQETKKENHELKKEKHSLQQMLLEKENTISRAESRSRELEQKLLYLQRENKELAEELAARKKSTLGAFIGRLLHNKPH